MSSGGSSSRSPREDAAGEWVTVRSMGFQGATLSLTHRRAWLKPSLAEDSDVGLQPTAQALRTRQAMASCACCMQFMDSGRFIFGVLRYARNCASAMGYIPTSERWERLPG